MKKYLFITYGEAGWRGVQMRALRIAAYLPREQVLFWNIYDPAIIHDAGFDVEKKPSGIQDPHAIEFPPGVDTVIFSDLPTNELGQWSIFQAARLSHKKIVVCEQVYRRGQLKEDVFHTCAASSDLFLVNALSSFRSEENGTIRVVPPQIEFTPTPSVRSDVRRELGIPESARILFGSGYNQEVLAKIQTLAASVYRKYDDVYTIITAEIDTQMKSGHTIMIPYCQGDEYYRLLAASDIALVKFGFLQILEALALHKPTIVLGEAGNVLQQPGTIDRSLEDVLYITDEIDSRVTEYVNLLLSKSRHYKRLVDRIAKLHDGTLYGARLAAEHIRTLQAVAPPSPQKKRLAILINQEIAERERIHEKFGSVYMLSFAIAMPTHREIIKRFPAELASSPLSSLQSAQEGQILPHSFTELIILSTRKYDGLIDIMPWFGEWIDHLKTLIRESDELIVSQQGLGLFAPLIKQIAPHMPLHILEPLKTNEAAGVHNRSYL